MRVLCLSQLSPRNILRALIWWCLSLGQAWAAMPALQARADWQALFDQAGVKGTIVVLDARRNHPDGVWSASNPDRAQQRYSPASTFKIPHSLFALDAGVLQDEFQRLPWDGVERSVPVWNADQTLRSAMRNSTVWVYEGFARQLGAQRERAYLQKIAYGNAAVSGAQPFWVEGDLAISAYEQIVFLRRLYRHDLPFALAQQRLVTDVMLQEAGRDWIVRGKTGWSGQIGWWVGWVEWPSGPVFFALNIDTPKREADLPQRQALVQSVLRRIDAWPASCAGR